MIGWFYDEQMSQMMRTMGDLLDDDASVNGQQRVLTTTTM